MHNPFSSARFDCLDAQFTLLKKDLAIMSKELDDLKAAVANLTTVAQKAATDLAGLAGAINAAKDDPAAIEDLANQVNAVSANLQGADNAAVPPVAGT